MYSKLQITGTLEVKTGLHIGGSTAFAAIGAVDSPVIRDAKNNLPVIPGSSLKGKVRTLLAKKYNNEPCSPEHDHERILRVFGSSEKNNIKPSRVLISDMFLTNEKELREQGAAGLTEVKFENTINRATAVANPRQIERSVRGSKFGLDIIYEVNVGHENEVEEDIDLILEGLNLLTYDYLGGNGSRGYGKVEFKDLKIDVVAGDIDPDVLNTLKSKLS